MPGHWQLRELAGACVNGNGRCLRIHPFPDIRRAKGSVAEESAPPKELPKADAPFPAHRALKPQAILKHRPFRTLWLAQFVSIFGDFLALFGVISLITFRMHGTAVQVTAVTNPLGLGFQAQAMVGIRTAGAPEPVADELSKWDDAGYVVLTAGQYDILVELVCADRRQLLELTNKIRSLAGVASTESFLYLALWKQLYDWGARVENGRAVESSVH